MIHDPVLFIDERSGRIDFEKSNAALIAAVAEHTWPRHELSMRGNEGSPRRERAKGLPGVADEVGYSMKAKLARKKKRAKAQEIARDSHRAHPDLFVSVTSSRRNVHDVQHFVPAALVDARDGARTGREAKRERVADDLKRRRDAKPPRDPIRLHRAQNEAP